MNWEFFLLDHVNGAFNVNSVFALHRLLLLERRKEERELKFWGLIIIISIFIM